MFAFAFTAAGRGTRSSYARLTSIENINTITNTSSCLPCPTEVKIESIRPCLPYLLLETVLVLPLGIVDDDIKLVALSQGELQLDR